ncbi:MAG: tRNA sulfurtransferase, partial [Candidatus Nanohalobium sp.]
MEEVAVIRYGEIGVKSARIEREMVQTLRQRIEDRIDSEIDYRKVSVQNSRITVYSSNPDKAAEKIQHMPGVKSVSPAVRTEPTIEELEKASEKFDYGETFGLDVNTGAVGLSSRKIAEQLGSHVEEFSGSSVDLETPETWLHIDFRQKNAYMYTDKMKGPGGFPAGTQGRYAALISGGIDSPVAAYRIMVRGADITPVYFYNKPIAAEDHFLRFKASVQELKKFNPSKEWEAYRVDMEEVNKELMSVGKGRMLLHRALMFKVAEKIAEKEGLSGLVTGESMGQKSSQTGQNLEITSSQVSKPVHRPLIGRCKNSVSEEARKIGTFEKASINSACRSLSPQNPSTEMKK